MTFALPSPAVWSHILAPTDLSPAAESGLKAAADLARRSSARVTILNVIDLSGLDDSWVPRDALVRLERDFRAEATPRLEALRERLFKGVPVEIQIVEGMGASVAIAQYARDHDVDVIVLASHGRTGFKRAVLGSVAERVVRGAPGDVIVVRSDDIEEEQGMEIKTILVPTDFSGYADEALERATQFAKLTQAEIHVLHAYEFPMPLLVADVPVSLPQEVYDQVQDAAKQGVEKRIAKVVAEGVKAAGGVICDNPTRAILDAAVKTHADLIVMGTHGRTGMKHVLLGSVAERIVRMAPCPVMTVKPPKSE
jgi:nucleotide-binding universal stress UspA family protein